MDTIGIERMTFEPERRPPKRFGPWSIAAVILALLGIGAVSPAAVDVLRWRDAVDDAKAVAGDRNASDRSLTNASTVLHRHAHAVIEELLRIAERGGEPAKHAEIYLRKLHEQAKR
jgi:hypothetical protein